MRATQKPQRIVPQCYLSVDQRRSTSPNDGRCPSPQHAAFEYLEIFHNRPRRHSSLSMLTPVEYEIRHVTIA